MTPTLRLQAAAVDALAALLPAGAPLECMLWPAASGEAPVAGLAIVAADYLGAVSAELALALPSATADTVRAAGGPAAVSLADVLRPALEAAAESLGTGVLGDVANNGRAALFADAETAVYRLAERGAGEPFAWFALRIRDAGGRPSTGVAEVGAGKLGRIHDVEMALSVVIGRTRMTVAELLSLEPGDVVDLDRSAGAPADILLNGRLIAHGEVVVVDQEYGVRVTKILDAPETVG
ncbi:flagellar motor switch protein FliN [Arthrobacter sp. STN4]|uniref:flagellar motor switch protein FliN n=1 Tax=Arthrobacter sp. STN4 TaxID=2923276 RepID=UPI002119EE27|nr:flagellar motor switch protein FliN [Arthrobacter sp. STN4]MCQ9162513.1 flagellar motor switch protein FliN [Arthrobacter sp. STN4]